MSELNLGLLDNTEEKARAYEEIREWLVKPPLDYFDFPASATAFCFSQHNSKPFFFGNSLFRQFGITYKMISYKNDSAWTDLQNLSGEGKRVKSLPFSFRNPVGKFLHNKYEYYANLPYNFLERIAFHSKNNRARLRRDYRQGSERYEVVKDVGKDELEDLFETWLREAKRRLFMVMKGHHQAYIDLYHSGIGGIELLGFRRKTDGLLYGVMGFEIVGDQAQMTLGKHRLGDNAFSTFYYVKTLETISERGTKRVLCGDSGDEFKSRIGLERKMSWRPVL